MQLPPVFESVLDEDGQTALFADLARLDALEVSVKRAPTQHADHDRVWTLPEARAALEEGRVRAIQVRYVFENVSWCDTILRAGGVVRIVRMAIPQTMPTD